MSRHEGYETLLGTGIQSGLGNEGGTIFERRTHTHTRTSSEGHGAMVFPSPSSLREERDGDMSHVGHHHHPNFQTAAAATPPQVSNHNGAGGTTTTSSNVNGGLGGISHRRTNLGLGSSADRLSYPHSHFRSSLADPIQSSSIHFNPPSTPSQASLPLPFHSSSSSTFYDSLAPGHPVSRAFPGSSSSAASTDIPSSVLLHHPHLHHSLHPSHYAHPAMGSAVPGPGQMQSQSLAFPLALNGSQVGGGGVLGSDGLGGVHSPDGRLLSNPSRRASIQQASTAAHNHNHLLNLHHHHHQHSSVASSPQSLSPVGSFFSPGSSNTSSSSALYSAFHPSFEADAQPYAGNNVSSNQSSSDSSPQSRSHAPQSPLSFQSSSSNTASSNNTSVTSATLPSKSATLRSTLTWADLEPWMDQEYAKQVCNLMGWDNVSVRVPHSGPDPATGRQANNAGYCFLTFPSPQHAASVLAQVNSPPGGQPLIMPNSSKPFTLNWTSSPSPTASTSPAPAPFNPLSVPNPTLLIPTSTPQQPQQQMQLQMPMQAQHSGPQQQQQKEYSIFVGDLAPETSNSDLVAVFRNPVLGLRNDRAPKFIRPFLSCKSAKIMLDPATGVSRGYGFVRFTDEADQQRALIEMHGLYCLSRPMRISPATAKFKPAVNPVPPYPLQDDKSFIVDPNAAANAQQAHHHHHHQQQQQQQPPPFVVSSPVGATNSVSTSGSGTSISTSSSSIPSLSSSTTASSVASTMPVGDLAAVAAAAAAANGQNPSLELLAQILAKANITIDTSNNGSPHRGSAMPSITAPLVQDVQGRASSPGQIQQQQTALQLQQQIQQQMQLQNLMGMNISGLNFNNNNNILPRYNFSANEEAWKHQAQARAILGNLIGPNGEQLTSTDPYNTTVFVGGLSPLISEETLRTFFAPFGDIHYVKVPVGKHCGFVQFVRKADAEKAIERMQGFPIGGSRIRLSWGRSQYKAAQAAAQAAMAAQLQASMAQPGQIQLTYDQAIELLKKLGLTATTPLATTPNGSGYMPGSAGSDGNNMFASADGSSSASVGNAAAANSSGGNPDAKRSMQAGGLSAGIDGERDRYGASAFSNGPFSATSPFGSRSSSVGPGELRPLTQSHSAQHNVGGMQSSTTSTFSPFSPDPNPSASASNFLSALAADRHSASSTSIGAGGESCASNAGGANASLSRMASSNSFGHRFGSGALGGTQTSTNLADLATNSASGPSSANSSSRGEKRLSSESLAPVTASRHTPTPQQQTKYDTSSSDAFAGFSLNRSAPVFQLNRAPGSRPLSSQSNATSHEDLISPTQHLHSHSSLSQQDQSDSEVIQDLNGTLASLDLDHSANASPIALRSPGGLPPTSSGVRSPGENSDSTDTTSSGSVQFAV